MKLAAAIHPLHPRAIFRISRGHRREVRNVFVRVEADGIAGYGEASPNAFYSETAESVHSALQRAAHLLDAVSIQSIPDIARFWSAVWPLVAPSRAAQCALDVALWDWLGRSQGVTASELAFGAKPAEITSFCTIGISDSAELESKVAELRFNPLIKIKSDAKADLAPVQFIRERSAARLAVDANCAWSPTVVIELSKELARLGVLFIEQPHPPSQDESMPEVLAASALPILADESCVTLEDVARIPRRFTGFNIKLVKCGGLTPALEMLKRGRELGLKVMVGCMLESSALIAAGAVIAKRTDYADLDGAWLLRDDPFSGLAFDRGILRPPCAPGLGVEPCANILFGAP